MLVIIASSSQFAGTVHNITQPLTTIPIINITIINPTQISAVADTIGITVQESLAALAYKILE